jgi:hypothetical protein
MIKDEKERKVYKVLGRIRRIINRDKVFTIRGIRIKVYKSQRGLAVKIVLSILSFNIYQLMGGKI